MGICNRRTRGGRLWFVLGLAYSIGSILLCEWLFAEGAQIALASTTGPKPYVFVTLGGPDDGGDFGPKTPGTKTGGIQEALHYAHQHHRDVYIWGGRCGVFKGKPDCGGSYELEETLRVPWSQDFRMDGGNYIMNFSKKTGDAVVIDSQMNCHYKFGLIVSSSSGVGVRIAPQTPGPDDMAGIQSSVFEFSAVCSRGTGIMVDSSHGPILNSRIFAEETNSGKRAMYLTGAHGITNNSIEVMYNNQYHAVAPCTCLQVGDSNSKSILHNRFQMSIHAPLGLIFDDDTQKYDMLADDKLYENTIGAQIFAQNNHFNLSFYGRKRPPGTDIIFEASARDNTVVVANLPNGITNRAEIPTNRVIRSTPLGFGVDTPAVPAAGKTLENRTSYPIDVFILAPGEVTSWTLADAHGHAQTITAGLTAGQTFRLEPAEKISFEYTERPTWRWKAIR